MESLLEVANLLVNNSYHTAITKIDELIAVETTSAEDKGKLQFYKAVAHSEIGDFDSALKDLESCEGTHGSNSDWLFRYGVAQFMTNDFANAIINFKKAEEATTDVGHKATVSSWVNKTELELGNPHVGNINDAIFIKADIPTSAEVPKPEEAKEPEVSSVAGKSVKDVPHDWFQNNDYVYLTFPKKKVVGEWKVVLSDSAATVTQANGEVIGVSLANHILSSESEFSQTEKKVEIKLKKKDLGIQWSALIKEEVEAFPKEVLPSYPTSNKAKKNWNKLEKDFSKELHKDKNNDEQNEDGLNDLFQQIYQGADEETRRAMIKSYQTSNGTVLSTNWDEVKEKDYEGKDYVAPPEEFVAQKPEY